MLSLGPRGQALIHDYEQLRLAAYMPTPNDVPTIGWGHTRGVRMGMVCTKEQADAWFLEDVTGAARAVSNLGVPLTESMADALVSLVYNTGPAPVGPTKVIGRALRAGDYFTAWAGFALWRKQDGKDLLGLARRRAHEMTLFFEDGLP